MLNPKASVAWEICSHVYDCDCEQNDSQHCNRSVEESIIAKPNIDRNCKSNEEYFGASKTFRKNEIEMRISNARQRKRSLLNQKRRNAIASVELFKRRHEKLYSVQRIQRWWRAEAIVRKRVRRVLSSKIPSHLEMIFDQNHQILSFHQQGDSFQGFDEIAAFLRAPNVLSAFEEILIVLCFPPKTASLKSPVVRSALSTFMINRFSSVILGTGEEGKNALASKVEQSSEIFERYLRSLKDHLQQAQNTAKLQRNLLQTINTEVLKVRAFRKTFNGFLQDFKKYDAKKLSMQFFEAYLDLVRSVNEVEVLMANNEQEEKETYAACLEGFKQQMASIEEKTKRILSKDDYVEWEGGIKRACTEIHLEHVNKLKAKEDEMKWKEQFLYDMILDPVDVLLKGKTKFKTVEDLNDVSAQEMRKLIETKDLSLFIHVVENIHERVTYLTPETHGLRQAFQTDVNIDLIKTQIEAGAFGKPQLIDLVGLLSNRLSKLQASSRDKDVDQLLQELHVISQQESESFASLAGPGLNFLLQQLKYLEVDCANAEIFMLGKMSDSQEKTIEYIKSKITPEEKERMVMNLKEEDFSSQSSIKTHIAELISLEDAYIDSAPLTLMKFDDKRLRYYQKLLDNFIEFVAMEMKFCSVKTRTKQDRETFRNYAIYQKASDPKTDVEIELDEILASGSFEKFKPKVQTLLADKLVQMLEKKDSFVLTEADFKGTVFFPWAEDLVDHFNSIRAMFCLNFTIFEDVYERAFSS